MRIVLILTAISLLSAVACASLDASLTDLEPGDCVVDPGASATQVTELEHTECSNPAALLVTDAFDVTGYDEFPGVAELDTIALERCSSEMDTYMLPTEESWNLADDRLVVCFAE